MRSSKVKKDEIQSGPVERECQSNVGWLQHAYNSCRIRTAVSEMVRDRA